MTLILVLPFLSLFHIEPSGHPAGESRPVEVFGSAYIPYNANLTLVYDTPFGETTSTVTRKEGITFITNESEKFKYHQKLIIDSTGVRIKEVYQNIRVMAFIRKENSFTYDRPVMHIPFPLTAGKHWSWQGVEYCDGESARIEVKGRVAGTETLRVPAGEFATVKIETALTSDDGSKNTVYEWLAPDVGIVRTRVVIRGGGLIGFVRDLMGYGEITFDLKRIVRKNG